MKKRKFLNSFLKIFFIILILAPAIYSFSPNPYSFWTPINVYNEIQLNKLQLGTVTYCWTKTEVVSTESTENSLKPKAAIDDSGNLHVVWEDYTDYNGSGTDKDIFYKCWNATSEVWTGTEVISKESINYSYDPSIITDGLGNVHIVWHDYTDYNNSGTDADIFYKCWNATTRVWNTTEVVFTESTNHSYNPTISVDGSENIHVAWEDYTDYNGSGTDADIFYKYWNATTGIWNTTEVVSTESTNHSYDPSIIADGPGNLNVVWEDYTDYDSSGMDLDIFYKRWNATTHVWSTTEAVSTESTNNSHNPTIILDNFGNIHLVWNDWSYYSQSGIDSDIFYKQWNATTRVWTTTEVVSTESTYDSFSPSIAVDNSGRIHITWEDSTRYRGSGPDWDIFYKYWNVNRGVWTKSEVVSTESKYTSWYSTVVVDNSSKLHVIWWDMTNYKGSGMDWDIFYKTQKPMLPIIPILLVLSKPQTIDATFLIIFMVSIIATGVILVITVLKKIK